MTLKIMEWNIHQQGRQWKEKISEDRDMPLWIIDQIDDDMDIVVFTEFNSHAQKIDDFYDKLSKKGFFYSTTNYSCGYSNDILIAIRKDERFVVEEVKYVKAYPNSPYITFDCDWSKIPENLRVDIKIDEKHVSIWGIRIKELNADYQKRSVEMETVMRWLKKVDGINILLGDFNNLREGTPEKHWNLTVLDNLLGVNYKRITPENHSWGVSQSVADNDYDGYIKNDHIISSVGTGIKNVTVEPYKWDYLANFKYPLEEEKYGKRKLKIPIGEPDHGILIAKVIV